MTTQPLNTFDEVQSGELVQFTCDEGYNVQGFNQLKCVESSWDVPHLPECAPSPCSLPTIDNAAYQVNEEQIVFFRNIIQYLVFCGSLPALI